MGGLLAREPASTTARSWRCWASTTGACSTPSSMATRSACMARVAAKKETSKPDRGVVVFDRRMRQAGRHGRAGDEDDAHVQAAAGPLIHKDTNKEAKRWTSPLSPEIEAVRDMVSRFMANEVVPVMEDFEKRQEFPRELIRKAGEAGLYGAVFPESVGGSDMGYMAAAVIIEEMSRQEVRFTSCNNQQGGTCPTCIYFGRHARAGAEVRAQPAGRQDDRHDVAVRVRQRLRCAERDEDIRAARRRCLPHQRRRRCGPRSPTRPTSAS